MSDAEAKRKRIDEENISTADLAGARTDAATDRQKNHTPSEDITDRQKNHTPSEDIIDIEPEQRDLRAAEVQKTDLTAQAVPVEQVSESGAAARVSPNQPPVHSDESERGPLFPSQEAANLRSKWDAIQVGFVDEPRRSVEEADSLVAATMKRLAEQFAAERSKLEGQWGRGSDVSTEDLRIALRRYRSFFGRLLTI